ncbi:hypothetical protein [Streptomyces sp. WELS2]|uniref:hypothetical protein n=1 Tax=Streptomyces sp. WELS2 TaxID=2749435 RepID=UPI0015F11A28|nr:hypothetical protein [Streptomyces sp. WELS2]
MSTEKQWEEAKRLYPVGESVQGTVKAKFPFGVFLELSGAQEVTVFLDIASYNPAAELHPAPLPEVGSPVDGVVSFHNERDKQIRVRVGPAVHHILNTGSGDRD